MKRLPYLSIITVCLNERDRIEQTAQSIVNQTYQNFEWIIIDGGSTDGTLEVLKKYQNRIQVFISEKDDGIYHAMNKGIRLARGEYCQFMNGGDYFYDKNVLKNFHDFKNKAGIVYGSIVAIFPDSRKETRFASPIMNLKDFFYTQTIPHQGAFFSIDLFRKYGLYDEKYRIIADRDFFARAIVGNNVQAAHFPFIISCFYFDGISAKMKNSFEYKNEIISYRKSHFGSIYSARRFLNLFLSKLIGRSV